MNDQSRARRFGEWLERRYRELGISEREFARLVGVTATTPRTWRGGLSVPSYQHTLGVAKVLGVSHEEVLCAAGYKPQAEATDEDADVFNELRTLWPELESRDRRALLAAVRALHDSSRQAVEAESLGA